MMETIWSAPEGVVSNQVLCHIIAYAINHKRLTSDDICLKSDVDSMMILKQSNDAYINKGLELIELIPACIEDGNAYHYSYKCRAIDPWIKVDESFFRLTTLNPDYETQFQSAKEKAQTGISFSINKEIFEEYKSYFSELEI